MPARLLAACLTSTLFFLAGAPWAGAQDPALPPPSESKLVTCTYSVADLVIPLPGDAPACPPQAAAPAQTAEDDLIRLVTTTVSPDSWSAKGGAGTVDYFPLTMALVVNQTAAVQEQIEAVLANLRKMQDVEVKIETRLVTVGEGFHAPVCPPGGPGAVTLLDDAQLKCLLESVQGDLKSNVMQTPKVTAFNGQKVAFNVTDKQAYVTGVNGCGAAVTPRTESFETGLKLALRPGVPPDRRCVNLCLGAHLTSLDTPEVPLFPVVVPVAAKGDDGKPVLFTQFIQQPRFRTLSVEKTLQVPADRTAVVYVGTRPREVRTEHGPPVLKNLPYVNRLFKNVGYGREREHVLVLVTPRVVVQEEEEQRMVTTAACHEGAGQAIGGAAGAITGGLTFGSATAPCEKACPEPKVARLVKKYHQACAEGRLTKARKLAAKALELDPACFAPKD